MNNDLSYSSAELSRFEYLLRHYIYGSMIGVYIYSHKYVLYRINIRPICLYISVNIFAWTLLRFILDFYLDLFGFDKLFWQFSVKFQLKHSNTFSPANDKTCMLKKSIFSSDWQLCFSWFSFGRWSPMNTVWTPPEPTRETPIFNWRESMSTIMRLQVNLVT